MVLCAAFIDVSLLLEVADRLRAAGPSIAEGLEVSPQLASLAASSSANR